MAVDQEARDLINSLLAEFATRWDGGTWGVPRDYSMLVRQAQPPASGSSQFKGEDLEVDAGDIILRDSTGGIVATNVSELTEESSPGATDWILLQKADGSFRKVSAANLGLTTAQTTAACATALSDIKLDHLVAVADADDPVNNSIIAKLAALTGDWSDFTAAHALQTISLGIANLVSNTTAIEAVVRLAGPLTADSGTVSTITDAALTQGDDYWNGAWVSMRSGASNNQVRLIVGFDAASDTLTVWPDFTDAIGADAYDILPGAAVAGLQTLHATAKADVNAECDTAITDAGIAVDIAAVKAETALIVEDTGTTGVLLATNAVSSEAIKLGAITANAIAADAVDKIVAGIVAGTTPMRGTDNAALAAVCTEARLQTLTDWIDGGRLDVILDAAAAGGGANVILGPVASSTVPGNRLSAPIALEIFQSEAKDFVFTITDADGEPVDLSTMAIRMVVYDTNDPPVGIFKVDEPAITISGAGNEVVTVPVSAVQSDTDTRDTLFCLWNVDSDAVLTHGSLTIKPAEKDVP